jgi:uncharacterized membrane protein HdeD (DUF308 family)
MLQVAAGLASKRTNWLLVAAGTIYTLFGFYVFAKPAQGALTLIWLIGLSTVVGGVALIVGAFDANRIAKSGSKR